MTIASWWKGYVAFMFRSMISSGLWRMVVDAFPLFFAQIE